MPAEPRAGRATLDLFVERLGRCTLEEVNRIARRCGIPSSSGAVKSRRVQTVAQNLLTAYEVEERAQIAESAGCAGVAGGRAGDAMTLRSLPHSIVSIDVGLKNMAYVHLTCDSRVLDWRRETLPLEQFPTTNFYTCVSELVHGRLLPMQKAASPNVDRLGGVFLIEHAPFRRFASYSVVKIAMVEAALMALLTDRTDHDVRVESINPCLMKGFLNGLMNDFEKDAKRTSKRTATNSERLDVPDTPFVAWFRRFYASAGFKRLTKKSTVKRLIKHWVCDHKDLVSNELRESYCYRESKKDDLADCLFQGIEYLEWRRFSINAAYKLLQDDANKYDTRET